MPAAVMMLQPRAGSAASMADDDEVKEPTLGSADETVKAYEDMEFVYSREGRPIRLLAEYLGPEARFEEFNIADTIVFFGSARIKSREVAEANLAKARASGENIDGAERDLQMSEYYEAARELAHQLTKWSKTLEGSKRRFVVCTGGGPGIMEAANRGASEAAGINIGMNISLPFEQHHNPYITRELNFEFHYFFMRKFWFTYLAKAIIVFPGGFGTMDEFFENLTLVQTRKLRKPVPMVLYGKDFWSDTFDLQTQVKAGTISADDLALFHVTDSIDDAFQFVTSELLQNAIGEPGGRL